MRLRNVRGSRETIAADECVLHDPEDQKAQKGHWHELFGNDHPIHIEVGMGKGQFIMTLAQQNPGYQLYRYREIFKRPCACVGEVPYI